jgi:hypothetical protein
MCRGVETPLLVEMVMDLGVNRAEFRSRRHSSKPLYRSLSFSKRLMRFPPRDCRAGANRLRCDAW